VREMKKMEKTEMEEKENLARDQARAQLDSIVFMVKRLEHVEDCDGDEDCQLTDAEIYDGLNLHYEEGQKATREEREEFHDEDAARQDIEEDPLSIRVRSGWHNFNEEAEDEDFEILLCTGGPAVRIVGELDSRQPSRARLEYQDWYEPWAEYLDMTSEERVYLLKYAQAFPFEV
jgi:hypothetical protein